MRVCRTCGHVGCCDQSKGKHATKHFHRSKHPIIEGYDPPEGWGWCYVDEVMFDLGDDTTPAARADPALLLKGIPWPRQFRKALTSSFMTEKKRSARCGRSMAMASLIYVENGGDFVVPLTAIKEVESEKVVLDSARLEPKLTEAIRRAHSGEDSRIP